MNDRFTKEDSPYLPFLAFINTLPHVPGHAEQQLTFATDEEERRQIQCEHAYLRGDFEAAKRNYFQTTGRDKTRICAMYVASMAAISTNDYTLFHNIYSELQEMYRQYRGQGKTEQMLWLAIQAADACLYLGKEPFDMERISLLTMDTQCYALGLYMKYLHLIREFEKMTGVGETALLFSSGKKDSSLTNLYLHMMCAVGYIEQHRDEEAFVQIRKALEIGLADGFITPFAEHIAAGSGRIELCIEQDYPDFYRPVIKQCEATMKNWISVHNQYARDNITDLLSVAEYQVANLAARGKTNAEIAKILKRSVSSVKKLLESTYAKLLITKRSELDHYIIWKQEKK